MYEYACARKDGEPDSPVLTNPLAVWAENPREAAELYGRMAGVGESGMTVQVERVGRISRYHVYLKCVPEICVRFLHEVKHEHREQTSKSTRTSTGSSS
jgi:hypothetical protein